MKNLTYLFIGIWALVGAQYSFAQEFDFSCESATDNIDISHISRPSRFSELTSINPPGAPDNQYYYAYEANAGFALAFQPNGQDNNGWRVRRNTDNVITGIKLGFNEPSFVEITGGTQDQIIQAALHAMANRAGDDDGRIIDGVTYSDDYELYILGINEFDTGRGERFYALETDQFTKAHSGNSNTSIVDLTPLSSIVDYNAPNGLSVRRHITSIQLEGLQDGDWVAVRTPDGTTQFVQHDHRGAGTSLGLDFNPTTAIGGGVSHFWRISNPTEPGIVEVSVNPISTISSYEGYYDLRGFNWGNSTHFDGRNGAGGLSSAGPLFDYIEEDANSGLVYVRTYEYDRSRGGAIDQSFASDAFGYEADNLVVMRSSVYPQGWGLYVSGGSAGGFYKSLWYSHDLRHQWQAGDNNDFQAKRHGSRLPSNARFIRN